MNAAVALKRTLTYGAVLAGAIAVVGGVLGFIFAGPEGLVSALIGTGMAFVFLGITAASILLAQRVTDSDFLKPAFFGIVLGGWLLKFILFLVLVFLLREQPWINPVVLFLSIVIGVLGSLVVDLLVLSRARIPYVDERSTTP